MAGVEKQDHDPGVEQQLQANRLVKEPGNGYRQKITERHISRLRREQLGNAITSRSLIFTFMILPLRGIIPANW